MQEILKENVFFAIFVVRKQQFIKLSIGRIKYWGESWAQEELHHR